MFGRKPEESIVIAKKTYDVEYEEVGRSESKTEAKKIYDQHCKDGDAVVAILRGNKITNRRYKGTKTQPY